MENLPNISALTTMLQLYIGVTRRCGWFWKAWRQTSLAAVNTWPAGG